MTNISKRAANIAESQTLAIAAKANKLKAEGKDIVSFTVGEPDFNTPDYIIAAAVDALKKGMTKYTASAGTLEFRKAICEKFKKDNKLNYSPENIVVSNGAKHSLHNIMQAVVDKGDEVIIPAPYWLTYPELVRVADGVPKFVKTSEKSGFKLTPEALEKAITKKTRAIIINSPSNPTGTVYTKGELYALAAVLEKYEDIYIISDEIYEKLVYNGAEHHSIAGYSPKIFERTIVVNGVSKTYSMTGWRIGYLAANAKVAKAIDNMQSHTTSNPNSIAQYATVAALNAGGDFISKMRAEFDRRRKYMVKRVRKIRGLSAREPDGAFYVMVNVSKLFGKSFNGKFIRTAQDVGELFIENAGAAVVPGEAFGAPKHVRLSYAISFEDIVKGLNSIAEFVGKLI